jgi:sulfatase-modifying factor enzyme 1
VVRGGSFNNSPENLRSANRDDDHPENRDRNNGFRCVRVPPTCRCQQRHAAPARALAPSIPACLFQ